MDLPGIRCGVMEDHLVKMAMGRKLTSLAIVALLIGQQAVLISQQAVAQQISPIEGQPEGMVGGWDQPMLQPQPEVGQPGPAPPDYPNAGLPSYAPGQGNWLQYPAVSPYDGCSASRCCEVTGGGYCCPDSWYVDQRVRVIHHPKPRMIVAGRYGKVAQVYTGVSFQSQFRAEWALASKSFPFETAAGYEFTVGHHLGRDAENRDHFVEFTYYGLNSWYSKFATVRSEQIQVTNSDFLYPGSTLLADGVTATYGNLFSSFDSRPPTLLFYPDGFGVAGFNRADRQWGYYSSRFDNFELNVRIRPRGRHDRLVLQSNGRWRRETQPGCSTSCVFGVRGVSLDENFGFFSRGTITLDPGGDQDVAGDYTIRTRNDMLGIQAGGDILFRKGRLEWGMRVKGAAMVNFADQASWVKTWGTAGDPIATFGDLDEMRIGRSRDVSGLAEFGFTGSYQLRTNMIVHAAYDVMFIAGLALAPEQLDFRVNAPDTINHSGLQMFQSFSLGLELTW